MMRLVKRHYDYVARETDTGAPLRIGRLTPPLVDEALKETEKGADRVGETKTTSSNAYVSISDDLYRRSPSG